MVIQYDDLTKAPADIEYFREVSVGFIVSQYSGNKVVLFTQRGAPV